MPAIVYAGTRRASEELAGFLSRAVGEEVLAYHAGLSREVRAATQERFMSGEVRVIVATNAFGMGIDKADVRTVCHATVPGSLEAYYQEAGRAGRDGAPARCLLFAEQRDKGLHVFFIQRSRLDAGVFERVAERLRWAGLDGRYDVAVRELAADVGAGGDAETVRAVIGHLVRAGLVAPQPAPPDRAAGLVVGEWNGRALAACLGSARDAERARWSQYRSVWAYVEGSGCRRAALLAHFGDRSSATPSVACCDVCSPSVVPAAALTASAHAGVGGGCRAQAAGAWRRRSRRRDRRRGRLGGATGGPDAGGRDPPGRALEGRSPSTPTIAWPATARSPTCARARCSGESISCSRPGRCAPPEAGFRSSARHERRCPGLRGRHQPAGAARSGSRPRGRADRAPWPPTSPTRGRSSGRGARGSPSEAFPVAEYSGRAERDRAMADWLRARGVELVVLAGYMQLLAGEFLARFPERVINVHPALLPAFPGLEAVDQAIAYGVKVFGVTVHFVDDGVDTGPVILQRAIELPDVSDAEAVLERLHPIEHELLPEAVRLIARGAVRIDPRIRAVS